MRAIASSVSAIGERRDVLVTWSAVEALLADQHRRAHDGNPTGEHPTHVLVRHGNQEQGVQTLEQALIDLEAAE